MATDTLGFYDRLKEARRKRVKKLGKRLIRSLAAFLGRQSLVGDTPVLAREPFPFLEAFEANWREIRAEVDEILRHREAVPTFQEISPDQAKIATGDNWRTFILHGFGTRHEKNCARAPVTARLLQDVPELQTAWFSILAPGYHIPPHRGVSKGILRCHLGLKVPRQRERCRMRVGDEMLVWREGELFVFDDTYEHEVWNDTEDERVVLIFDFDRPMRFWGRAVNNAFVAGLKRTAYFKVPKRNLERLDERFEAAVREADAMLEGADDGAR